MLQHFLSSDSKSFTVQSKLARHNKVWLSKEASRLSEWRIIPVNKRFRMELEQTPVPVSFLIKIYALTLSLSRTIL